MKYTLPEQIRYMREHIEGDCLTFVPQKPDHLTDEQWLDEMLQSCPDAECERCAEIVCPQQDGMHFHGDGCPSCFQEDSTHKADASAHPPEKPMNEATHTQPTTMKQTTKQTILWAWNNVPDHYRSATPLLAAIAAAINDLPDGKPVGRMERHLGPCAERIGKEKKAALGCGIPALNYADEWVGDWDVTNADLRALDLFRMWLGRAEDHTAKYATSRIFEAAKFKRAYQAYLRYQESGLTAEHCALLANMGWEMDLFRGDWVSLFVQGKRPFGNSSIAFDIFEHAGWEMAWDEEEGMLDSDEERAWNLFDELIFAAPDAAKKAAAALASQNK